MSQIDRREFLQFGGYLAALMGLGQSMVPAMADALEQMKTSGPPVIWLQAQSCSGCSVSFLNSNSPGAAQVLTEYISLRFHSTISAATGEVAMDVVNKTISEGGFVLAVEGSIPSLMPEACLMGGEEIEHIVKRAAKSASAVLALGTCASFGGIPAAENNPTGAIGVPDFMKHENISTPAISIPGCPFHPDWFIGTLAHILKFGLPELDELGRPAAYFSKLIHDQCPRFADYEREKFAEHFSDDGCLFKLGCLGPVTHADCTVRPWNGGVNSCIKAGAPCIGCAAENFAARASLPFYLKGTVNMIEKG